MSSDFEKEPSVHLENAEGHGPDNPAVPPQTRDDVPDGGTIAWLQVLGGYFVFMDTW